MIDQLSPPKHRRAYGRGGIDRVESPLRARSVPYISIMLATILPTLIIADVMPLSPPLGYIVFLGWRMMRPGLMPLWIGVPLGAFDDLFSGQPFGSGILLWSLTMIALELIETRFPWRGFWQDWFTAGLASVLYIVVAMAISGASITPFLIIATIPQIMLAVLFYPLIARLIALLDSFRLSRTRRI